MAKYFYTRVCSSCGNTAEVTYKPKEGAICSTCARKTSAYNMSQNKIGQITRYTRTCIDCGDVKDDCRAKPKEPQRCATCSRQYHGKLNFNPEAAVHKKKKTRMCKPRMRYFRVCILCDDVKQVGCEHATRAKMCAKCSKKVNGENRRGKSFKSVAPKPKKAKTTKRRQASPEAIARARQLNLKHREKEAKKPKIPKQTKTEEQMMAEWLESNKVTVIEPSKLAKDTYGKTTDMV